MSPAPAIKKVAAPTKEIKKQKVEPKKIIIKAAAPKIKSAAVVKAEKLFPKQFEIGSTAKNGYVSENGNFIADEVVKSNKVRLQNGEPKMFGEVRRATKFLIRSGLKFCYVGDGWFDLELQVIVPQLASVRKDLYESEYEPVVTKKVVAEKVVSYKTDKNGKLKKVVKTKNVIHEKVNKSAAELLAQVTVEKFDSTTKMRSVNGGRKIKIPIGYKPLFLAFDETDDTFNVCTSNNEGDASENVFKCECKQVYLAIEYIMENFKLWSTGKVLYV